MSSNSIITITRRELWISDFHRPKKRLFDKKIIPQKINKLFVTRKQFFRKINYYKHASEVGDRGISNTKYKDD